MVESASEKHYMSTHIEPVLTVADLDTLPEDGRRYELIEGELLVSRSPSLLHQRVSMNLAFAIKGYLLRNPVGEVWATPGVIFSDVAAVIPDIAFVSEHRTKEIASGDRITGAPDLIIEIVSPSGENDRRDRVAKRQLYGKYGVREYWLVDPQHRVVEVYCLEAQTLKPRATLGENDELRSDLFPGLSCRVEGIFSR